MTNANQTNLNNAKTLQKSLVIYSALGMLAIGVSVAIASILPLYDQLKQAEERSLLFAARTRGMAIEESVSRAKSIALQIASRTKARQQLEAYNQGDIPTEEFVRVSQNILTDALNQSPEVVGITRLDREGKKAVGVGMAIPPEFWLLPPLTSENALIRSPIELEGESYLIVGAPILDGESERLGTDIVLFQVESLERIVEDYTGLGQTGETILGSLENDELQVFFPLRNNSTRLSPTEKISLEQAALGESGLLRGNERSDHQETLAFEPLEIPNWGVLVKMDREELYAPVNRQIFRITIAIALLTTLGTGGMVLLLRPLAGKAIVQTDELEQQIQEKTDLLAAQTAALDVEKRQNVLLKEALAGMDELKASAQQVADACAAASGSVDRALSRVEEGTLSVERSRDDTLTLKHTVEAIAEQMERLGESTREISTIAALVGNLATQTNMLALNAAVEAARAGEKGRGFSVVAAEIRKLADRSRQSAEKINRLLGTIQQTLEVAAIATKNGTQTVHSTEEMSRETAANLTDMREAIASVTVNTRQISLATQEQASAIEQVVEAIDAISHSPNATV